MVPGHLAHNEVVQKPAYHKQAFQERNETQGRKNEFNRKPTSTILEDSMVKRIPSQDLNRECPQFKTYVKTFSGAKVEDMFSYVEPTMKMNPDRIILMCGTNNLRDDQPEIVANKLISLAIKVSEKASGVAVSGIVYRGDSQALETKRRLVNRLVENSLKTYGIEFIYHDNLTGKHLDKWGLHPNFNGNNLLVGNFISFINNA